MRKQSINLDRAVELLADPKMTYAAVGRKLADEEGRAVTYQPHSIRIISGKEAVVFGFAQADGTDWFEADNQSARMRMYFIGI